MEVNSEVLEELKCSLCDGYLSCSPVFLLANGASVCGRCPAPENQVSLRNTPYERLAKQMKFPCKYKSVGCLNTTVFRLLKMHENGCKFRLFTCPVSKPGVCDWTGLATEVLKHCEEQHPDTVVQNSMVLEHDNSRTNARTFVLAAFQLLFIVYAKVCLSSGQILHSVHSLFNADKDSEFNFDLVVSNKNDQIIRTGTISTLEVCLEDNPVILELFGGLDGTSFEITVNHIVNEPEALLQCVTCKPEIRACCNVKLGCVYKDTLNALLKHQNYYCEFNKWCHLCFNTAIDCSRPFHFYRKHSDIKQTLNSDWSVNVGPCEKYFIFDSIVGLLHCSFIFNIDGFEFVVRSPLSSDQLQFYTCNIQLYNREFQNKESFILKRVFDNGVVSDADWEVSVDRDTLITKYLVSTELHCSLQFKHTE